MPQEIAIQDEKAQKFLQKAIEKVKTMRDGGREFAMRLSSIISKDIISHFDKEEGPDGSWPGWSNFYREHMERIGKGGNKLLQYNGTLRQAFVPTNYRKVGEGILWYNPAKTKSGFPYAFAHNEGGPKLPARTFMWASEEASEQVAKATLDFVLGKD